MSRSIYLPYKSDCHDNPKCQTLELNTEFVNATVGEAFRASKLASAASSGEPMPIIPYSKSDRSVAAVSRHRLLIPCGRLELLPPPRPVRAPAPHAGRRAAGLCASAELAGRGSRRGLRRGGGDTGRAERSARVVQERERCLRPVAGCARGARATSSGDGRRQGPGSDAANPSRRPDSGVPRVRPLMRLCGWGRGAAVFEQTARWLRSHFGQ